MREELIAPCGMNCAVCAAHLALNNDIRSKGIKMPYCRGCRPRNKQCALIKKRCALLLSGEISFCYECRDFPCANLLRLDKRYKANFRMSLVENLRFIKEKGITAFLSAEGEKWKCPGCGQTVCCHNGLCFNCGLEKLRDKSNKLRRGDA